MALRTTLMYLGEPDPESTTLTLPIPNVGTLGRGVPQEITGKILAHFDDVSPEALAHRLADLYNRNQRLPRLRVRTEEVDESTPEPETTPETATTDTATAEGSAEQETPQTDPEPTPEPAPQGDGSIPESPQE